MPITIVITHFVNLFAMVLLIRSGLNILADHPKLYWTDHTTGFNYWVKFSKKEMPKDRLFTSHDEMEPIGHWALPGGTHRDFGSARNWHFAAALLWVISGAIYWGFMFVSGAWSRLIPTSWDIFPQSFHALVTYLHWQAPPVSDFQPYDALQQLAYASVVFLLAPLMIITAAAMSPAVIGRFPGFLKIFGGRRQIARSLHFIGMLLFSGFILIHITLVALVYFYRNVRIITFGTTDVSLAAAVTVFLAALLFVLLFNVWASYFTLNHRMLSRRFLVGFYGPVNRLLLGRLQSRQHYNESDISPYFRVNGYPPTTEEYARLRANRFTDWRLEVGGNVDHELALSLEELKQLPDQSQITKHVCIQGWTDIAQWQGVRMQQIVEMALPHNDVRFVVFYGYDENDRGEPYYVSLSLEDMHDAQTMLAYGMNGGELPIEYGAPIRLRCEKKLGYKMIKYLRRIEFVHDFAGIGKGLGGSHEDDEMYDWEASI